MKQHFVTFYSPGTFFPEETAKPIDSWDIIAAMKMATKVVERHGAIPYGFQFSTRERKDNELDSKVVKTSNMYYLGGTVESLEEIKTRASQNDKILIANMEANHYNKVIINTNSWKTVLPFNQDDVVLQWRK